MWPVVALFLVLPSWNTDAFLRSVPRTEWRPLPFPAALRAHDVQVAPTSFQTTSVAATPPTAPPGAALEFVSIEERTTTCLDFAFVLECLRNSTVTVLGADIAAQREARTVAEATQAYAMVEELSPHIGYVPLRTSMNVWPILRAIEMNTAPPERDDLASFSEHIESLDEVREYFETNLDRLPLYMDLAAQLGLPEELAKAFKGSFDEDGNLNAEKYPELGRLRRQAEALRGKIIQVLQTLLRTQDMKEKLADNGFTEMEGRYCLMLKNTYKKGVGIVHGASNTGRTIYVEPMEVVAPTNEMKSVLGQMRAEENKILFEMCQLISQYREEIKGAVTAAAEIDVLRAKARLGARVRGVVPEMSDAGCLRCVDAKHPVLLLRGVEPVGNSVALDADNAALVISGPNAGGKTVVLKTAGLFALMAKHAIPLPTRPGARVDFMQVMADIGDMQTVSGDLSTFSGHLVVCREMLRAAEAHKGHSLVLLDEIGTGTDPAQGAALAQAVLEELLNLGTRVIVTTHYQRIKELAADDQRFQIAAMEFIDNRPTYRLRLGSVGESYALEAGRRMALPEHVLERANALLDDESRRILALQKKLEEETDRARQRQAEFEGAVRDLAGREAAIERSKALLEEQIKKLREGKTEEFLKELRAKERELEGLIKKAQEAATQSDLSRSERERAVEDVKREVRAARTETETKLVEQNAEDLATPLTPGEPVEEGTTLIVLEKGTIFGSRGIVTQRNKGRGRVFLRVAGVEVKMERHLLGRPHQAGKMGFLVSGPNGGAPAAFEETLSAKDRRMRQMLMEELVDPDKQLLAVKRQKSSGGSKQLPARVATNTLDVRTKGLDEIQQLTASTFERMLENEQNVVYLNHGVAKTDTVSKLRAWLKQHPFVRKIGSAESDAVTVVELDFDE